MDELLDTIRGVLDGPIDFKSQKFTEDISYKLLIVGAILSSLAGFVAQDIKVLLVFSGLTILVTLGIVIPPYPGYNTENIEWYSPKIGN
ncbi:Signal peptidase complex subunit SPC1 [Wickerhamomyces ciferrii]|uniref:Signal peptidase complex subunit SPC1 n=1 Tax=Wickerhamomyces ciferrii (strain ATCC 14091 / BCRC 22168 / CBS 111 / JCM 3599 / NBRC 0793 / NRRL Y-1031 F-60-10) TaxID=1206466 RepID=K0KDR0_WICCF|nr:Signal peptidase complex subunit SPC1 [Wickerhamomyces ciferrii]CCH43245.1 Signal peptidase complex subunit SPC1 [Wickerhamomyces ciferrii]